MTIRPKSTTSKKKKPSHEGEWYGVALDGGGYGAVIVLREVGRRRFKDVLLGTIPRIFDACPTLADVSALRVTDLRSIIRAAATFVKSSRWTLLGRHPDFSREHWPIVPVVGSDRTFAYRDTPDFDFLQFSRDLIPVSKHKYFMNWFQTTPAESMELIVPDLVKEGRQSKWYIYITEEHLKVLEQYLPAIIEHGRFGYPRGRKFR